MTAISGISNRELKGISTRGGRRGSEGHLKWRIESVDMVAAETKMPHSRISNRELKVRRRILQEVEEEAGEDVHLK